MAAAALERSPGAPPASLWRVAWLFVPAAMIYAIVLFGARGWGITGGSYVSALVRAGTNLQGWMPIAGAWCAARSASTIRLSARLARIQGATGLMMAALYVILSLATTGGPNPWFSLQLAVRGPALPLSVALVVMATWAFTALAMVLGTLTRGLGPAVPSALAAAGLALWWLRWFAGGTQTHLVNSYLWLQAMWMGGSMPLNPPTPMAVFWEPFLIVFTVWAAAMLALWRLDTRGALNPPAAAPMP